MRATKGAWKRVTSLPSMEYFPGLYRKIRLTNQPTNQSINQKTDIGVHSKVTLPIRRGVLEGDGREGMIGNWIEVKGRILGQRGEVGCRGGRDGKREQNQKY